MSFKGLKAKIKALGSGSSGDTTRAEELQRRVNRYWKELQRNERMAKLILILTTVMQLIALFTPDWCDSANDWADNGLFVHKTPAGTTSSFPEEKKLVPGACGIFSAVFCVAGFFRKPPSCGFYVLIATFFQMISWAAYAGEGDCVGVYGESFSLYVASWPITLFVGVLLMRLPSVRLAEFTAKTAIELVEGDREEAPPGFQTPRVFLDPEQKSELIRVEPSRFLPGIVINTPRKFTTPRRDAPPRLPLGLGSARLNINTDHPATQRTARKHGGGGDTARSTRSGQGTARSMRSIQEDDDDEIQKVRRKPAGKERAQSSTSGGLSKPAPAPSSTRSTRSDARRRPSSSSSMASDVSSLLSSEGSSVLSSSVSSDVSSSVSSLPKFRRQNSDPVSTELKPKKKKRSLTGGISQLKGVVDTVTPRRSSLSGLVPSLPMGVKPKAGGSAVATPKSSARKRSLSLKDKLAQMTQTKTKELVVEEPSAEQNPFAPPPTEKKKSTKRSVSKEDVDTARSTRSTKEKPKQDSGKPAKSDKKKAKDAQTPKSAKGKKSGRPEEASGSDTTRSTKSTKSSKSGGKGAGEGTSKKQDSKPSKTAKASSKQAGKSEDKDAQKTGKKQASKTQKSKSDPEKQPSSEAAEVSTPKKSKGSGKAVSASKKKTDAADKQKSAGTVQKPKKSKSAETVQSPKKAAKPSSEQAPKTPQKAAKSSSDQASSKPAKKAANSKDAPKPAKKAAKSEEAPKPPKKPAKSEQPPKKAAKEDVKAKPTGSTSSASETKIAVPKSGDAAVQLDKKFECEICGASFFRERVLQRHMRTQHGEE